MRQFVEKEQLFRPIEAITDERQANSVGVAHSHEWCQLQYATHGVINVKAGNYSFIIPPQRAVWIPTGVVHQVNNTAPASYRSFHIESKLGDKIGSDVKVIQVSPFLRELIHRGCDAWQGKYHMSDINSALMTLLIEEIHQAPISPLHLSWPTDPRLKRVCELLHDNPGDNRNLSELAQYSGASVRTLNRLFAKECQLNFTEWRQKLRILTALELLQNNRSITDIALELGYESSSAFITVFKKHLNSSPKAYIRNLTTV
ncbi:AraC family transcriptional regulator [Vibrio marisflavi]|uniref:HTH-type transcriptional regulator NimR n=1 Tax=Vibrio marisflavi CECT 7928 TaxID=634439 RepID=A0ABN8E5W4_9VIBR|nr:helix-turn-helix transcriptional regulator [Vibrio marisflavi]CAH0540945.1 HTH-type transcriptional regulator NimR [Vibrio marisflavi CECT 7928]